MQIERPPDVLVVGAGPAGATAALVLARAGARVTLLDRARFPRSKLCGDTLNPGTLALLQRLGLGSLTCGALPLEGMRLTGPGGVSIAARYPRNLAGAALSRREFDGRLLSRAVEAGAGFEEQVTVTAPLFDGRDGVVRGAVAQRQGATQRMRAAVTIAADGRTSRLVAALDLARQPAWPRRWAIGAYYEGVQKLEAIGEMHLRRGHYIGVAPLPGGLANAILVVPLPAMRESAARLPARLDEALRRDPLLAWRFTAARALGPPVILGPMAMDVGRACHPGLLLAGDAAGFVDPMTGDGMRLAIAGGVLAARAALAALEHGWAAADEVLTRGRRRAFARKLRFNRALRRLTAIPSALSLAAHVAPLAPSLLTRLVAYAGDVNASPVSSELG